jgi:transcriptional regulator
MYTPKYAVNTNEKEIQEFIRQNGFGILVNTVNGKLWATHTPFMLSSDSHYLSGHIAKANLQGRSLQEGEEVLVIFQGAHTYISSSWYDHENVPTWNYMAAHVYGTIQLLEGDALKAELRSLVNEYEKTSTHPVSVDTMSSDYVEKEMRGIVGIRIEITKIESSFKLSQNRDDKNYHGIVKELEKRTDDGSHQVAKAMKKLR